MQSNPSGRLPSLRPDARFLRSGDAAEGKRPPVFVIRTDDAVIFGLVALCDNELAVFAPIAPGPGRKPDSVRGLLRNGYRDWTRLGLSMNVALALSAHALTSSPRTE